jgi:hypothetical protein
MDFIKIDTKKLKLAGSSFLKIAYAILIGIVFIVLNLLLSVVPNGSNYMFLCWFSYGIIIYHILKNLIIAGKNLKTSETRDSQKIYNIIGKPIQIENLLVSQYDLNVEKQSIKMNWDTANELCDQLNFYEKGTAHYALSKAVGGNWRLPTKDELDLLYANKEKIGNFSNWIYWSSTIYEERPMTEVWTQSFLDLEGYQNTSYNDNSYYVRAVMRNNIKN